MSGILKYRDEIKKYLVQSGQTKYLEDIMETVHEVDTNMGLTTLDYDTITQQLGEPKEFAKEFLSSRVVETKKEENEKLKQAVQSFNMIFILLIPYYIFIRPFMLVLRPDGEVYDARSVAELASEQYPFLLVWGSILVISFFATTWYYQSRLLYQPIHNLVSYFRDFMIYVIITTFTIILLHSTFLGIGHDVFNLNYNLGYNIEQECSQQYGACYRDNQAMWNTLQWLDIWVMLVPIFTIFASMFYRLQTNGFSVSEFEQMEQLELDTSKYGGIIKKLYLVSGLAIFLAYFPIWLYAFSIEFQNLRDEEVVKLLIISVDTIITTIIIVHVIMFIALAYTTNKMGQTLAGSDFTPSSQTKYQLIYLAYFVSTLGPDNSFLNTDGYIVVSSYVAFAFIVLSWFVETKIR